MINCNVNKKIKMRMVEIDLKWKQVAISAGITFATFQKRLRGAGDDWKLIELRKVAQVLELTVSELIG